jgi:hypothetical protein
VLRDPLGPLFHRANRTGAVAGNTLPALRKGLFGIRSVPDMVERVGLRFDERFGKLQGSLNIGTTWRLSTCAQLHEQSAPISEMLLDVEVRRVGSRGKYRLDSFRRPNNLPYNYRIRPTVCHVSSTRRLPSGRSLTVLPARSRSA